MHPLHINLITITITIIDCYASVATMGLADTNRQDMKDMMLGPDKNLAPFDISLLERVAVRIVA